VNAGIILVLPIRPQTLPFISFPIHYSLINLIFDADHISNYTTDKKKESDQILSAKMACQPRT
jgi:hypothetical protein